MELVRVRRAFSRWGTSCKKIRSLEACCWREEKTPVHFYLIFTYWLPFHKLHSTTCDTLLHIGPPKQQANHPWTEIFEILKQTQSSLLLSCLCLVFYQSDSNLTQAYFPAKTGQGCSKGSQRKPQVKPIQGYQLKASWPTRTETNKVLISWGCWKKNYKPHGLNTTKIYFLIIVGVRNPNWSCQSIMQWLQSAAQVRRDAADASATAWKDEL